MKLGDNKNNKIEIIIYSIIILTLIIIALILYLTKIVIPKQNEKNMNYNTTYQKQTSNNGKNKTENTTKELRRTNEEIIKYLSTLNEGNRMEYYCGKFLRLIEDHEYEKAYSYLNKDFINNYFPTAEDFKKYIINNFPEEYSIEYDDVQRFNDVYVLRLKIYDYKTLNKEPKIQRVVIKEHEYNNYEVSFQVEKESENGKSNIDNNNLNVIIN